MNILKTYNELFESVITHIDYSNKHLTELPKLPNTLEKLYCNDNQLTELPKSPKSLNVLICKGNDLPYENIQMKKQSKILIYNSYENIKNI